MAVRLGKKITARYRKSIENEIMRFANDHWLWHKHVTNVDLNPHQVAWCNQMDSYGDSHLLIGSRRIRKSFTVAAYLLKEAATKACCDINVHSPALEQSKRNLRYMTDMIMGSEILLAYIENKLGEGIGKEYVEFMNGSKIRAKGQASSTDGLGATHQWLEEFDDMDWNTFLTRIYPTGSQLKDDHDYAYRNGCFRVITGTIKGQGNIYKIEHPEDASSSFKFNVLTKLNCFTPDTLVLTSTGHKPICDVMIGDQVVTHKKRHMRVIDTMCNKYDGDLIQITPYYSSGVKIKCTPNHKILTTQGMVRADELTLEHQIVWNDQSPEQVFVNSPYAPTKPLMYLAGLYLSDGCFGEGSGHSGNMIIYSFNKKDHIGKQNCLDTVFEVTGKKLTPRNNSGTSDTITVCSNDFAHLMSTLCGRYSKHKRIHPCIESLPDELKQSFLLGAFAGDGCIQKNSNGNSTMIQYATCNQKICCGIARLLTQLGVRPTTYYKRHKAGKIQGRNIPESDYYSVQTERIKTFEQIGQIKGGQKFKTGSIRKIERVQYSGYVYNLNVDTDHTYVVGNGAVVSNCHHGVRMGIIPSADIELARTVLFTPDQYARTFLCLYVESKNFYPDKYVRACADHSMLPIIVVPGGSYANRGEITVGIDCGGAGDQEESSNWSISITEKVNNRINLLYQKEFDATASPNQVRNEMAAIIAFFHPKTGYGDAFDSTFIQDLNIQLKKMGVIRIDINKYDNKPGKNGWDNWYIKPLRFHGPNKHIMHERMQKYIYGIAFRYPTIVEDHFEFIDEYKSIEKLIRQFGNVKAERSNAGYNKYSAVNSKLGLDSVDSCIASVWAQEEIKVQFPGYGLWTNQMDIADRPQFDRLGRNFLYDGRRYKNPDSDVYRSMLRMNDD